MKITCPNCSQTIPADDIALDKGLAKCTRCDEIFQLAELVPSQPAQATSKQSERPFDAWCVTEREGNQLIVHVPPMGMRAGVWAMVVFATFWLGFIAFWTAGASGLFFGAKPGGFNFVFAAFSIPFWIVGFGMVGGILWTARGSRIVLLDASQTVTELRCFFWRRRKVIDRAAVQCAREGAIVMRDNHPSSAFFPYPAEIIYENGSFKLPCNSQVERDWLIAEINGFLQQVPSRPAT